MKLVTGATGLVGGHLLYRFRESANTTIATYRSKDHIEKTRSIFKSYNANHADLVDDFIWKKADILEIPSIELLMPGVQEVYHCAAAIQASSFRSIKRTNIMGTENMINVALAYGVEKFCHVSSISALGDPVGERPINEEDFFNLDARNTDYAISKYGAEMEVWRATQEGMDVVIVNPGIILGEGDWNQGSGKLFKKSAKGNRFYTSGSSGFIDVRDVVKAMTYLMQTGITNERYLLTSENLSYKNVLDQISSQLNQGRPKIKLGKYALYLVVICSYLRSIFKSGSVFRLSNVDSLLSKTTYSNKKASSILPFKFNPIEDTIKRVCMYYLKDN